MSILSCHVFEINCPATVTLTWCSGLNGYYLSKGFVIDDSDAAWINQIPKHVPEYIIAFNKKINVSIPTCKTPIPYIINRLNNISIPKYVYFFFFFFIFFWDGLGDPIALSLLGGGIPAHNSGYKVTRRCPYSMLSCYFVSSPSLRFVIISKGIPSSSLISSSLSDSDYADAIFSPPSKSNLSCSHHGQDTRTPGLRMDRSQRSRIGRVAIYCRVVLWLLVMYVLISSKPASTITSSNEGYY